VQYRHSAEALDQGGIMVSDSANDEMSIYNPRTSAEVLLNVVSSIEAEYQRYGGDVATIDMAFSDDAGDVPPLALLSPDPHSTFPIPLEPVSLS
jgi:hypothetical protein